MFDRAVSSAAIDGNDRNYMVDLEPDRFAFQIKCSPPLQDKPL